MTIDKWLSKKDSTEEQIKREKIFKSLSKDQVQDLKKKKIQNLVHKDVQKTSEISDKSDFLDNIIEFKKWLNQRTYLKGDAEKIETWIKNLYSRIQYQTDQEVKTIDKDVKREIIKKYKEIPPNFLDEKTRIAINKKIHGTKKTSSDNYYLRKLKTNVQEKLREAKYYEILDKLLKL